MGKKKKNLLIALPVVIVVILTLWLLFGQTPQAAPASTLLPQPTLPIADIETPELPRNLLVVPEVPLGSLAIVLACFVALLISQRRSKGRVLTKV